MSIEIEEAKLTPMMTQWTECKRQAKEALLFFRLGDFYEAFHEDAELIAKELNLTLTERQGIAMCGVPWHTSEAYVDRLVARGYRVAVAEQMEDPRKVKGLVKRQVVRCVSPGTQVASSLLNEKTHNFFAAISKDADSYGLALLDVTTANFFVFECQDSKALINELCRYTPKELLTTKKFQENEKELLIELKLNFSLRIQTDDEWRFERMGAVSSLCRHFHVATLDGFGLKGMGSSLDAAGALLQHVKEALFISVDHISSLSPLHGNAHLLLDRATLANLEIIEPLMEGKKEQTLLYLLDETKTPMGARKLREWLASPLISVDSIAARQDAVAEFIAASKQDYIAICRFDDALKHIRDIARLIIRIQTCYAGPREYVALSASLAQLPCIKKMLLSCSSEKLKNLCTKVEEHTDVVATIQNALIENPPLRITDGGLFRPGYHLGLDELRNLRQNSQEWLAGYQTKLREETGIKTLKVGYNKMFGYFIEVSRGQVDKMPETFSRRQTLVNGERYITPELKEYEEKILSADEKIADLEQTLFQKLQLEIAAHHTAILKTADAISEVDALRSLAIVAEKRGYVRPLVDDSHTLTVVESRHPVIEALASFRKFIPNDITLDGENKNLMLITGPNMAGKSTYIRQVALVVILAQIGAFIPAKEAHIGIVDKLFSRIGASDDLARGQSTFMVEMAETASILHQATSRSLVILDEIGRGTSTYDGISIAWSVAEYLLKIPGKRAKTLFATHYYELTELEHNHSGAINYTVAISEGQDEITFLHKIIKGKTNRSYGVHVAQIAGMPAAVVERAKELLELLEKSKPATREALSSASIAIASPVQAATQNVQKHSAQPDLFSRIVLDGIKAFDLNNSTPVEAFTKIMEWKKLLQ